MQGERHGGPAACYRDPSARASLMALLDDGFPGLAGKIAVAAAAGWDWGAVTEPFVRWEDREAVAHVGVLAHRVVLAGEVREVAGIHAVVTRSDRRGRGLARSLLAEALAWADARFDVTKLGTGVPEVYAGHGFRAFRLHRFVVDHAGGEDRGRPVDDVGRFWRIVGERDPVSHRFASLDPGWLVGIDLALQGRTVADLVALDPLDAVVDWRVVDGVLIVEDVFSRALPPLADLLALAPPHRSVRLACCPDRLAPGAAAEAQEDAGWWMARGDWPLFGEPVGMGWLAEH